MPLLAETLLLVFMAYIAGFVLGCSLIGTYKWRKRVLRRRAELAAELELS